MAERKVAPRLGEFLRARRALVRPEEHGMPAGTRRTPGLRREEVAMLAGVSTDYYIRLEQGREKHPSPQVVEALAGALWLEDEAAAYLRGLADPGPARSRRTGRREYASPGLVELLEAWPHTPALIYGRYFDLLAVNPLGEALFCWAPVPARSRAADPARSWAAVPAGQMLRRARSRSARARIPTSVATPEVSNPCGQPGCTWNSAGTPAADSAAA
jgi:transcriptional regulator with XRE-family HTH domain